MKRILVTIAAACSAILMFSVSVAAQDNDWAGANRYASDNAKVLASGVKPLAVFMGDSITDAWAWVDMDFFTSNNCVPRGFSGQTTNQMVARFRSDVIALHPKYVVILAGTNDIAYNLGPELLQTAYDNIVTMCEIAKANKIKPVICSVTPTQYYGWRMELGDQSETVKKLNGMLKEYAAKHKIKYCDYYSALVDERGGCNRQYSKDDVHPTIEGYKVMEPIIMGLLK